jgi:hypothetical protein
VGSDLILLRTGSGDHELSRILVQLDDTHGEHERSTSGRHWSSMRSCKELKRDLER